MPKPLSALLASLCVVISAFTTSTMKAAEVNCHNGSSINGIEGFEIQVFCNPLAERIMIHRTLIEDYARNHLSGAGLDITDTINPESGVIGITLTSVEWLVDGISKGYATSLNVDLNRAALCLLGDDEFHAISSIVWHEDRLLVADRDRSRDFILDVLEGSLDKLVEDLENADPVKYISSASTGSTLADSGDRD